MTRRSIIILLAFALLAIGGFAAIRAVRRAHLASEGLVSYELRSAGHRWEVFAHNPAGAPGKALVIVLHGAGGSGDRYLTGNHWVRESDRRGFVVIAPNGLPGRLLAKPNFLTNPRLWNSGQLPAGSPRTKIDDVAFLSDLISDARQRFGIDPSRVFVTGHSNGCGMTFKFASERADLIRAIAPSLGQDFASRAPSRSLPTLYILGEADPLNPLQGGTVHLPWGSHVATPIQVSISNWGKAIGASETPETVRDDEIAKVQRFGPSYEVWMLKGQGHAWPGGESSGLPERVMGPNPSKVDATSVICDFFARYGLS